MVEYFGWDFVYVDKSVELLPTIEKALYTHGNSLIVVPIHYRENSILTNRLDEMTIGL